MSAFRDPVPPIVKSHQRAGCDYDVQTVDRGLAHHCIVTNLFYDGQLLITRTVPYLEKTPVDYVRALMDAHHTRLTDELTEGQLDEEIQNVLTAAAPRAPEPVPSSSSGSSGTPGQARKPPATPPTTLIKEGSPKSIVMTFVAPSDFLAVHTSRGQHAGLLVESGLDLPLGEKVEVALRFSGSPMRQFMLFGQVAWRRRKASDALRAGFGVDFPADQKVALEHVVEFALGIHDVATMRQFPRVRCAIQASITPDGGKAAQQTLGDVSAGGMFVPCEQPLPKGAGVTVRLKPEGWWFALKVRGVVVWSRTGEHAGMGVRFLFDKDNGRTKLARLVEGMLKV